MKLRPPKIRGFRIASALLPLGLLACNNASTSSSAPQDTTPAAAPAAVVSDGYVAHLEPAPGIRFPMPAKGDVSAKVFDFDSSLPAEKFRHEIDLGSDQYVQILIHVWDNPAHLAVHSWFDQNMAGFVDDATAVSERSATKTKIPAIVLEEPASDQAVSQSVAVFATRDHVYSVTCMDPVNDASAKKLFDHVVDDFEPEIKPVYATKAVTP